MSYNSIPHLFISQAKRYKEKVALQVKKNGYYQPISWSAFHHTVASAAYALSKLGINPNSHVAILSENRPEWAYVDLAVLGLGAVVVPVYATCAAKEVEYVIQHSTAEVLFVSNSEQLAKTAFLKRSCTSLKHIIAFDASLDQENVCMQWVDFLRPSLERAGEELYEFYQSKLKLVNPDQIATIIYTSGTTGAPKGVMLTHKNFLINCEDASKAIPMGDQDTTLSFLPLSHVFERMAGYYYPIHQGATISYAENMNTVPKNLIEIKPTVACAVPRLYEKIFEKIKEEIRRKPKAIQRLAAWSFQVGSQATAFKLQKRPIPFPLSFFYWIANLLVFKSIRRGLGGRLKFFISGGAPLPKSLGEFFYAAGVLILEGYGLTETSPVIAANRPDRLKFGTVGPLFDHVKVKIADDGEILASGPSIMKGYYQNEEATRAVIKEGWFATGDIGELDSDGFLKITDRKKEIIVTSGGKKVSPQNVENLLCASRFIKQSVVLGDKHNYLVALITPNLEAICETLNCKNRSPDQVMKDPRAIQLIRSEIDTLTSELSNYEKIKYFRFLPTEMSIAGGELTPTMKIKRKVIGERYSSLITDMYVEGEEKRSS